MAKKEIVIWNKNDVAGYLRLSPRTVERYFQDGIIKSFKVGRKRVTTKETVEEFLLSAMKSA